MELVLSSVTPQSIYQWKITALEIWVALTQQSTHVGGLWLKIIPSQSCAMLEAENQQESISINKIQQMHEIS